MDMDKEVFTKLLKERLSSTDINMVKRDVLPFIQNPQELDIWSNEYFFQLADRVKFLQERFLHKLLIINKITIFSIQTHK